MSTCGGSDYGGGDNDHEDYNYHRDHENHNDHRDHENHNDHRDHKDNDVSESFWPVLAEHSALNGKHSRDVGVDGVSPDKRNEGKGDEAAGDNRVTQCGVGSWRPDCLQPCATIWSFTAVMCLITIFGNLNYSYYTAVITQIERCYGLSSSTSGFIKNIDNIGFMITVIFVSHFGRHANKPRIFAIATVLSSGAIFIFAVPHFIYGGGQLRSAAFPRDVSNITTLNSSSRFSKPISKYEVCDGVDESAQDPTGCSSRNVLLEFNRGAFALFIISEFLQGMAMSPKYTLTITYMDDNARDNSPKHFGILFGMRAFSPILGFMLGAWTNSLYVDLTDPGIDRRDPRWIGAWWLGFVICSVCALVWAVPLILFPRRIAGVPENTESPLSMSKPKDAFKGLFESGVRLLTNPVYVCIVLGGCCNVFLMGFATFQPKYIESYFGQTASMASIYTGIVSALAWSIGPIVGGRVLSRRKMTTSAALRFTVMMNVISIVGFSIAMFLGCSGGEWAGTMNLNKQEPNLACNTNCSCDVTSYTPVCGSDGFNYYSPCYAGCSSDFTTVNTTQKIFSDCQCIPGGIATLGVCSRTCYAFYVYLVVLFVTQVFASMMIVPIMMTLLRCVDEKDKAMSLAISAFVTQLAAFPAPIMFGMVVDSVCLVKQTSCIRKGACLLYDHDYFRFRLHGFAIGLKCAAMVMYLLAWYCNRRMARRKKPAIDNNIVHEKDDDVKVSLTGADRETIL